MRFECAHDELVELHKLVENPRNPNKHPDRQIEMLAKIIDYQGQRAPIVVSNQSGFIVKGHGRLEALKRLGWEKAAVDFQDYESEAQEFADLVADNKIAELAEHDDNMMIEGIKHFEIDDFELLGLDDFALPDEPIEAQCDEDEVPEQVDTRCKPDDIWQLGRHRLMCGDSTSIDAVERLMNGEKADMVFTDPPYGMNLDTDYSKLPSTKDEGNKKYRPIAGDGQDFRPELINSIFASFNYCSEIFIFGADYFAELLSNKNNGSWIVWDKRIDEKFDKMFGSAFELCWSKNKHKREIARFNNTLFGGDIEARGKVHPTQKPTKLIEWFFNKWGNNNDLVADLFGGSGSTLIACEKTNRKCFMMEIDPHYCDVILARWEKYTGKQAVRLEG